MIAGATFPLHTGLFRDFSNKALILSRVRAYTEGMTTNTTTNRPTFNLTVAFDNTGAAVMFEAETEWFDTEAEAAAIVAGLPKSVGARVRECSFSLTGSYLKKDSVIRYAAGVWAQLRSTKNNQKNETGLKRLDALMKNADINYAPKYANSPATLDAALASL